MALAEKIKNGIAKMGRKEHRRPRKIWIGVACGLACSWIQAPVALAQRGQAGHQGGPVRGGHAAPGAHPAGPASPPHALPSPAPHATAPHPPVIFGQRAGIAPGGFGQRPIFIRHHVFLRATFFPVRLFYPSWWVNCGPAWVWGFGCGDWRAPEYHPPNYVTPLVYEYPVYVYYDGYHQFVELFLKDGTAFTVTDYWFVNDQVHFTTVEEDGTKSAEEVIGLDELDVQKTIDVNTRRGFRIVRRDEPLQQYLRDHPDANAPLLEPPPKS